MDLAKFKIRVNAIAPGAVRTKMIETLKKEINNDKAFNIRMTETHPLGRIAKPEEIAKSISFLASEDASFITGIILPVDGGRSIR